MAHTTEASSNEILPLTRFYLDRKSHEVLYKCPHCHNIRGFDDSLYHQEYYDFVGSIFTDNLCGNVAEIDKDYTLVSDVEQL